jgi:hypothetical protein
MLSDLDLILAALEEAASTIGLSGTATEDAIAEGIRQVARTLQHLRAEAVADGLPPASLSQAGELIRQRDRWQREAVRLTRENDESRTARLAEQQLMNADLRDLLDALGLHSGARPQSPHEVMREAIEEVRKHAWGGA